MNTLHLIAILGFDQLGSSCGLLSYLYGSHMGHTCLERSRILVPGSPSLVLDTALFNKILNTVQASYLLPRYFVGFEGHVSRLHLCTLTRCAEARHCITEPIASLQRPLSMPFACYPSTLSGCAIHMSKISRLPQPRLRLLAQTTPYICPTRICMSRSSSGEIFCWKLFDWCTRRRPH
jgi:hypothetical protein